MATSSTWYSLVGTLVLSLLIMIISVIVFIYMRRRWKMFFLPMVFDKNLKIKESDRPEPLLGSFDWIVYTWNYPISRVLQHAGIDAIEYLNFLWHMLVMFMVIAFFNVAVLMPINASSVNVDKHEDHPEYVNGIELFYIGNVEQKSHLLWFHLVSVWFFSAIVCYACYRMYDTATYLHTQFLMKEKGLLKYRTVIVHNIPSFICNTEQLQDWFNSMYHNYVERATIVPKIPRLQSLQQRRKHLIKSWKQAVGVFREKGKRMTVRIGGTCKGVDVDAITYYEKEIPKINEKIIKQQSIPHENTSKGFVTFATVAMAMQCAQTLHHSNALQAAVYRAPFPQDINWRFLTKTKIAHFTRGLITYTVLGGLMWVLIVPVTLTAGWSNLNTLSKVPTLSILVGLVKTNPTMEGIINGFLPNLVLNIFVAILPILLKVVLEKRGYSLYSRLERNLMRVYWVFLFVDILLLITIAGSLFNQLSLYILHPDNLLQRLATALPSQATFFTNYIIIDAMIAVPFLLARIPDFLLMKIQHWFVSKTEEEYNEAAKPYNFPFEYSIQYARELLILNISIVFSSMSPVITLFAVAYFALAYFRAKYNYIFVYPAAHNEGIAMTPLAINRILIGLVFYQLSMFMLFSLKLFAPGSFIIPLVLLTVAFHIYIHKKLRRGYNFLSLSDCMKPSTGEKMDNQEELEDYTDPALKPPEDFEPSGIDHIDIVETSNLLHKVQPSELDLPTLELEQKRHSIRKSSHFYEEVHPPLELESTEDHQVMLEVQEESDEE